MYRVYEGSASQLVLQAHGTSKSASSDELAEIEQFIQRWRYETGGGGKV